MFTFALVSKAREGGPTTTIPEGIIEGLVEEEEELEVEEVAVVVVVVVIVDEEGFDCAV